MLLQKSIIPVQITKTDNLSAVVYWFVLHLDDVHKLSTGPLAYETVSVICRAKKGVKIINGITDCCQSFLTISYRAFGIKLPLSSKMKLKLFVIKMLHCHALYRSAL